MSGTKADPGIFPERKGLAPLCSPLEDALTGGGIPFLRNVPLSTCGTWRIGGPADFLVEPGSWTQTAAVLRCAGEHGVPAIVIGKGSNLLFDDAGLRGVAIRIGHSLTRVTITGTTVRAESGISASHLARTVALAGLSGLEHIVGIPGTLGGLVFMNGGSLQRAIGEAITEVKAMDRQETVQVFRREDCVIMEATMDLVPGRCQAIFAEMLRILRDRRRKLPLTLPSCGSVFKRDPHSYATFGPPGKIVESAGLKGVSIGGAAVSERHANFIVNKGDAAARDVLELIELIRRQVARRTGLALECEVQLVPSTGHIRPI